jgi:hypothetical protein
MIYGTETGLIESLNWQHLKLYYMRMCSALDSLHFMAFKCCGNVLLCMREIETSHIRMAVCLSVTNSDLLQCNFGQ